MQRSVAKIAKAIAAFEPVVMLGPKARAGEIRSETGGRVAHWPIPTDDLWCRDSGPIFVQYGSGDRAVTRVAFNGWGEKQNHVNDGAVSLRVAERLGLAVYDNGLIGEGGGVELDGAGTALAHESSWINPNRNRQSRDRIEQMIMGAFGVNKVIWAPGLAGQDITDFHIDSLARFVSPGKVLIQAPARRGGTDPFARAAQETLDVLKAARDASGSKLELILLPEPKSVRSASSEFVASYVNYFVCNGAVIAAQFGDDKADAAADSMLKSLFPDREIVMLDIDPIAEAGGGVHCATREEPAGRA